MEIPYPSVEYVFERLDTFGICDKCNEYSKSIALREGEWVCQCCERMV